MGDRLRPLVAAVVSVGILTSACATTPSQGGDATVVDLNDDGMHGSLLDDGYEVPDTQLTDTDGAPFSLAEDLDRPLTLVFFGYSNCPDICQTVMSALASARTRLDDAQRDQVDVVFVTTDPARDDAATLRTYLDRYDPSFIGLTADLDTVIETARPLAVAVEKGQRLATGGYEVDHTASIIGIEGDRAPIVWSQTTSAADFAADITILLEESDRS
ncbi:SCO family protein [Nocardioides sp.]|uniref:SCO family protein n=1 Tax=Nocardioides sp. TaxID=35761 RepID=UPI002732765A|nr:SCO family protein [Nocardioides sp.]MDP3892115.1 SCO family protein [Nocardioides sp.]